MRLWRIDMERRYQASANRHQYRGGDHKRRVVADFADHLARKDTANDQRNDHRQNGDAGIDGALAFDRLEPDGKIAKLVSTGQ